MAEKFHDNLRGKMDNLVHFVYKITKNFPKDELYGATSQLRRAALSVILNYIEGYARKKPLVKINFFEIAYGSLQESKYLLEFAVSNEWVCKEEAGKALALAEEIGAMLWKTLEGLRKEQK